MTKTQLIKRLKAHRDRQNGVDIVAFFIMVILIALAGIAILIGFVALSDSSAGSSAGALSFAASCVSPVIALYLSRTVIIGSIIAHFSDRLHALEPTPEEPANEGE